MIRSATPQERETNRILLMFCGSVAALVAAALLACSLEWSPGNQSAIYEQHMAQESEVAKR